jgi:hypothetical protein
MATALYRNRLDRYEEVRRKDLTPPAVQEKDEPVKEQLSTPGKSICYALLCEEGIKSCKSAGRYAECDNCSLKKER